MFSDAVTPGDGTCRMVTCVPNVRDFVAVLWETWTDLPDHPSDGSSDACDIIGLGGQMSDAGERPRQLAWPRRPVPLPAVRTGLRRRAGRRPHRPLRPHRLPWGAMTHKSRYARAIPGPGPQAFAPRARTQHAGEPRRPAQQDTVIHARIRTAPCCPHPPSNRTAPTVTRRKPMDRPRAPPRNERSLADLRMGFGY